LQIYVNKITHCDADTRGATNVGIDGAVGVVVMYKILIIMEET
jgi:hypothetical protein